jgi:hypothetical protein
MLNQVTCYPVSSTRSYFCHMNVQNSEKLDSLYRFKSTTSGVRQWTLRYRVQRSATLITSVHCVNIQMTQSNMSLTLTVMVQTQLVTETSVSNSTLRRLIVQTFSQTT